MPETCRHPRTRLIAEDESTRYLECLDCGALYEEGEVEPDPAGAGRFEEDLSDA